MKRRLLLFVFVVLASVQLGAKIKVACVGDSVTYGAGIEDRDNDSYPVQLGRLLGDGYDVRNFGHSGATLLYHGHRPYTTLDEYPQALEFAADLVVIHLGLNDTDPRNWPDYSDEFIGDYRNLIDSFRKANPDAKIWICLMTPIMHGHKRFLSGTRDWHAQIQDAIRQIAATDGVGLIDLFDPLIDRTDLFPDNLHPIAEGAGILAKTVYSALTGDFGGLSMSPLYTDGMVLQRGKPLAVRGVSDAGEQVQVELKEAVGKTGKGRKKKTEYSVIASGSAVTSTDGSWSVTLPSLQAGGPYVLEVSDSQKSLTFNDVWTGEVWVCTGQSNMAFMLKNCSTAEEDLENASAQTKLHLFDMTVNWPTDNVEFAASALDSINRLQYFTPSGWQACSAETAKNFSAVGYHFGRSLSDSLGCHVGIISCGVGGATTESWVDYQALAWKFPEVLMDWYNGDFGQPWARERAKKNISNSTNPKQRHPYEPGYLFSAGAKALDRYGIRGLVWYQGESNAHNIEAHENLFGLMVESWRNLWNEPLPVQMVQLSGIATRPSWPKFRDSQRRIAENIDGVEMTVCSDLGNPTDVHPRDKRPVGERVTASALHYVYDRNDVVPSGPVYKGFTIEGKTLRLKFDFADGIKAAKGFEIAGADGIYYPAEIKIDGQDIILSGKEIEAPCAVRYAWQPNPAEADLTNSSGMPCSTFKDETHK